MKRTFVELEVTAAFLVLSVWIGTSLGALSGWSSAPTQYHVQNDEGPDRFFRYQTFNGQYRKERRMDDGTVVGSYGWVDPTGYLRMTDYVADGKGYRIVNSRMEFVGVKPDPNPPEQKPFQQKHTARIVRQRNLELSSNVTTTAVSFQQEQAETTLKAPTTHGTLAELTSTLSTVMRPPKRRVVKVLRKAPLKNVTTMTPPPPPLDLSLETFTTTPPSTAFIARRPFIIQVTRGDEKSGKRGDVFKGYATPLRSGNGFLYKIPNQYHKEETGSDGRRVGSFGYVDPFGIRRVIHYNAKSPEGFDAQVDSKYVGREGSK